MTALDRPACAAYAPGMAETKHPKPHHATHDEPMKHPPRHHDSHDQPMQPRPERGGRNGMDRGSGG